MHQYKYINHSFQQTFNNHHNQIILVLHVKHDSLYINSILVQHDNYLQAVNNTIALSIRSQIHTNKCCHMLKIMAWIQLHKPLHSKTNSIIISIKQYCYACAARQTSFIIYETDPNRIEQLLTSCKFNTIAASVCSHIHTKKCWHISQIIASIQLHKPLHSTFN